VPLLTHPGRSMISRMGASVNTAMGLSHLVAKDREGLKNMVIEMVGEPRGPEMEGAKLRLARDKTKTELLRTATHFGDELIRIRI